MTPRAISTSDDGGAGADGTTLPATMDGTSTMGPWQRRGRAMAVAVLLLGGVLARVLHWPQILAVVTVLGFGIGLPVVGWLEGRGAGLAAHVLAAATLAWTTAMAIVLQDGWDAWTLSAMAVATILSVPAGAVAGLVVFWVGLYGRPAVETE